MVKNLLESVCYRLPDSVENSCVKMVDEYSSMIMTLIANNADAGQGRNQLNLSIDSNDSRDGSESGFPTLELSPRRLI
jgi:hypothetical protein